MFRVCYTVDAPYAGGAERYISLICGALDKKLFEPFVLVKRGADLTAWRSGMERIGAEVVEAEMDLPFRPAHAPGIFNALRRIAPDIVHINMPGPYDGQMGLLVPMARFAGATGVVTTEHLPMVERTWKRAFIKSFSYRWIDRVLTVCDANVPYLVRRQGVPPAKISVVHNALPGDFGAGRVSVREKTREHLNLRDDSTALAMVGSLIERKGFPVLLEALVLLEDLSWQLIVVGEGEERARYERLAVERGVGDRVRFMGEKPADEVEALLCAVDLLVLPSFMEAMPYVILEAMACCLPIVASRIYGIPEMALDGETACLVPPGDVDRLSVCLREMITNPSLRGELGDSARKRFERYFTIDKQIEAVQKVYLELLGVLNAKERTTIGNESTP